MPKDDLADLRLDLAPKLNRPLSPWKPLDYLRLLFWAFYFPQGIAWHIRTFGSSKENSYQSTKNSSFKVIFNRNFHPNPFVQIFFYLGTLIVFDYTAPIIDRSASLINFYILVFLIHLIPYSILPGFSASEIFKVNPKNKIDLGSLFGGAIFGILSGSIYSVFCTLILFALYPVDLILITFNLELVVWGVYIGFVYSTFMNNGIIKNVGIAIDIAEGIGEAFSLFVIILLSGILLVFLPSFQWGYSDYLNLCAFLLVSFLTFLAVRIRIDSWLIASFFSLNSGFFLRIGSATFLRVVGYSRRMQSLFEKDWNVGIKECSLHLDFTYQFYPIVKVISGEAQRIQNSQVFDFFCCLDPAYSSEISKFSSVSIDKEIKYKFFSGFYLPSSMKDFLYSKEKIRFSFANPSQSVGAGFWYLHDEKPAEAAQAFAVVRDIRHGEEMHGLASLLALFDAAETAEQIAAIELPDLPRDRTLRPQTWDAIRRFYHVVSDTKTAQASASRAARAFATNRALGELQHIIEYEADLPEAERSLVIKIAKTWQSALLEITAAVGEIDLTQPVRNPYVIGDPVEGDLFVGRDDILRQLQELWLLGNHLQSVVIYGHRRMGKTSILRNVSQVLGSGLRVAYVNLLQSAGAENISDVLLAISDQVAAVLPIDPPRDADMVAQPARTFERFFRRAIKTLRQGEGLIIAIDEFEKIEELIAAGKLGDDFMAYLRGLVQDSPRVGFAFAGLHTLEEMSADYFQPFFASVIPIKVDFFKQATVQTLLPNPGGDFPLDYDFDALDLIWQLTAGQPYLTQLIGFQLVRRYNDQVFERQQPREAKFTVADVQAVISQPEFFAQGKPYFAGVWAQANHDTPGQQAILNSLAPHPNGLVLGDLQSAAKLDSATFSAALATLQNHDVVRLKDGSAQIIVEVFRRWVSDRANN